MLKCITFDGDVSTLNDLMEYLEKICDKVGNITLGGGRSVLEQLAELVH